jgi:predicted nucleic acid-binding protein
LSYLLDTNVASERLRKAPSASVLEWIGRQRSERLFLSTVTIAEIQFGISALDAGRRRTMFEDWLADLLSGLGDRLLPIDRDVATAWGHLRARAMGIGRQIPAMDAFIAATAEVHGLIVVTRNVRDFEVWGGPVFNPWIEDQPA